MGTLIDSSVFIAVERGNAALQHKVRTLGDCYLSAVTVEELLHGVYRAKTENQRLARVSQVELFLQIPIIPFDERVARVMAPIDAGLKSIGQTLPIDDLMIAATALTHGHSVATLDMRSFPRVPNLVLQQL